MEQFILKTSYITLGQLLKVYGFIDTGGQAKVFLQETDVFVNGIRELRRGRKLMAGDVVTVSDQGTITLIDAS